MNRRRHLLPAIFLLLFAAACYFPLFLHLDHMSLRLWDEGRRSVNAFEMAQSGNLLVTYYDGKPEMWGTKPPFLIWCQAAMMKIVGYNELAVRLPSALAALTTVVLLILFCWKVLNKPLAGFFAGLALVTTKGYVGAHVARSGDFDSLLTLWETAYLLSFFTFYRLTDLAKKRKWLYITAGFIALAGLTKGIAGFLFLPGILLYALFFGLNQSDSPVSWRGQIPFLRWKHTWLAALLAIAPLLTFYLLREIFNPGYLAAVSSNEVGGRYLETQGGHFKPWYHYFEWLYIEQFQPWLLFLPLAWVVGFSSSGALRRLVTLLLLSAVSFLFIISFGQTRIMWYMAPVYPTLSLMTGIAFEWLVDGGRWAAGSDTKQLLRYGIIAAFVLGMFWQPYAFIIKRIYFENHPEWDWHELKYRDFMRQTADIKTYTIVHAKYNSHVTFYKKVHNLRGYHIESQALVDFDQNKFEFGKGPLAFQPGAVLMVCEQPVFAGLDTVYTYNVTRAWDTCKLLTIKEKK
jgi:4-amino-4-deoxy-L-arabinose transferase-like glycosyltransferase